MAADPVPYGEWPSPITAADVAAASVTITHVRTLGAEVWWDEMRPEDEGRTAVVRRLADGTLVDVLPQPWDARSRVHEYGGRAWLPMPGVGDDAPLLLFANWDDQRLYVLEVGSAHVRALTPEPAEPAAMRYAEPVLGADAGEILCVREAHYEGRITRRIVAIPLDGSGSDDPTAIREVAGDSDFLASPRVSPDGSRLAWIAWDHPRMPWDGTELRVAELEGGVAFGARTVLGGSEESVLQPEWADDETVYAVSDRTGWWNLYRLDLGPPTDNTLATAALDPSVGDAATPAPAAVPEPVALCPREEEFGFPLWLVGYVSYGLLPDGRVAVLHGVGTHRLGVLDVATGELTDLAGDLVGWEPTLAVTETSIVGVAGRADRPVNVVAVDLEADAATDLRPPTVDPPRDYLPRPVTESFLRPDGRPVYAHVYAPSNPEVVAPTRDGAPYVVFVHGGPTSQASPLPTLGVAFFTSRGIGVVDVDYGGSTGYGRAYRELLRGQWGVVDVQDCVAVARALVARGAADPARLGIRGGSAGGWTTLAAVATTGVFAAAVSYFGVADLLSFVAETHDFESRYIDTLVGPLPDAHDRYVERSPLTHAGDISTPTLLLQGAEDLVVPPAQSLRIRDALAARAVPHAYLEFAGEQHGFRRAGTMAAALEAELSFYGQIFGFDAPGIKRLAITGR